MRNHFPVAALAAIGLVVCMVLLVDVQPVRAGANYYDLLGVKKGSSTAQIKVCAVATLCTCVRMYVGRRGNVACVWLFVGVEREVQTGKVFELRHVRRASHVAVSLSCLCVLCSFFFLVCGSVGMPVLAEE